MTSGWFAAVDRVRASWLGNAGRAELVAAGTLLILAVAAFAATAVVR